MEKLSISEFLKLIASQLNQQPAQPVVFRGLPLDWMRDGFIENAWEWVNMKHADGAEFLVNVRFYQHYLKENELQRVFHFSDN